MLTVGIETSGQSGSVALVEEGRVLAASSLSQTGRRHARTLVSELKSLLEQLGYSPRDCGCVAVSIGPGSFTGLRVGVVCAKTFAYATGCEIVSVDTLQAIAAATPTGTDSVHVLVDAMRGDVFHARYDRQDGNWVRQGEIGLSPWRKLLPTIDPNIPLTGPALTNISTESWAHPRLPESSWTPTAALVALIGEEQAVAGNTDDVWQLQPLYIRKSAAEEKLDAVKGH